MLSARLVGRARYNTPIHVRLRIEALPSRPPVLTVSAQPALNSLSTVERCSSVVRSTAAVRCRTSPRAARAPTMGRCSTPLVLLQLKPVLRSYSCTYYFGHVESGICARLSELSGLPGRGIVANTRRHFCQRYSGFSFSTVIRWLAIFDNSSALTAHCAPQTAARFLSGCMAI